MRLNCLFFIVGILSFSLVINAVWVSSIPSGDSNIDNYMEVSEINDTDLITSIGIGYWINNEILNYSNYTTITIYPQHNFFYKDIENLNVSVCEGNITGLSLTGVTFNCLENIVYDYNISYTYRNTLKKIESISIRINHLNMKAPWVHYVVNITYKSKNFTIPQGLHTIAWFDYSGLPQSYTILVILPRETSVIEKIPGTAIVRGFDQKNRWIIELHSEQNQQIWFYDRDNAEKWTPLFWALGGAFFGVILSLPIGFIVQYWKIDRWFFRRFDFISQWLKKRKPIKK